jgi:hypothetical protein
MQDLPNLDPLSEMMVLSSYKNANNLMITAIELKGILDEEALDAAARKTATRFPQFLSRIRELRESGKFYLAWEQRIFTGRKAEPELAFTIPSSD